MGNLPLVFFGGGGFFLLCVMGFTAGCCAGEICFFRLAGKGGGVYDSTLGCVFFFCQTPSLYHSFLDIYIHIHIYTYLN